MAKKYPYWEDPEIEEWELDEDEEAMMRAGERQCGPLFGLGLGLGFIGGIGFGCRPRFFGCRPRFFGCRPFFFGCRPRFFCWPFPCRPL